MAAEIAESAETLNALDIASAVFDSSFCFCFTSWLRKRRMLSACSASSAAITRYPSNKFTCGSGTPDRDAGSA